MLAISERLEEKDQINNYFRRPQNFDMHYIYNIRESVRNLRRTDSTIINRRHLGSTTYYTSSQNSTDPQAL